MRSRNASPSTFSRAARLIGAVGLAGVLSFLGYGTARLKVVESRVAVVAAERDSVSELVRTVRDSAAAIGLDLAESRCALGAAAGMNAYHDDAFALAVELYDRALVCDPADGYVLGLKAYSLFKSGDLQAALAAQRDGMAAQPDDPWGRFNLARFLCAAGDFDAASEAMRSAVSIDPSMAGIASDDGEFQSLCGEQLRL